MNNEVEELKKKLALMRKANMRLFAMLMKVWKLASAPFGDEPGVHPGERETLEKIITMLDDEFWPKEGV